jgi:hypothetical protein
MDLILTWFLALPQHVACRVLDAFDMRIKGAVVFRFAAATWLDWVEMLVDSSHDPRCRQEFVLFFVVRNCGDSPLEIARHRVGRAASRFNSIRAGDVHANVTDLAAALHN